MKRYILLVFLAVLLSGCDLLTGGSSGGNKLEKDVYKGTEGIKISSLDNVLPKEVFEKEFISFSVKAENKGVYSTNPILLVSLEKGYMAFSDSSVGDNHVRKVAIGSLEGKDVFNNFDDFKIINLPIRVGELRDLSEYHDSTILATVCYDYQGIAFADVCIDKDPYNANPGIKPCTAKSQISLSEGQGGPVAITSIETRMLVDEGYIRPQFKIHVRNMGPGNVIRHGTAGEVCSSSGLESGDYNTIDLVGISMSGHTQADFECSPLPLVLKKEEDYFTCTMKKIQDMRQDVGSSFQTPLKVEIRYGYMESLSKGINIKKILKY